MNERPLVNNVIGADAPAMGRRRFLAIVAALLAAHLAMAVAYVWLIGPTRWRVVEVWMSRDTFEGVFATLGSALAGGLALAAYMQAGRWRWLAGATVLALLVGLPRLGPSIELLFVPEPGIDHGAWQEDIPPTVTAAGWLGAIALLAILSWRGTR